MGSLTGALRRMQEILNRPGNSDPELAAGTVTGRIGGADALECESFGFRAKVRCQQCDRSPDIRVIHEFDLPEDGI
jgi:hypothetical protein